MTTTKPVARPAPALRAVAALTAMELRLTARRGENVLVTLIIPVAVLLFFGGTSVGGALGGTRESIVAGSIALAIIAAGFVNLGIATAYERSYGVLKRLAGAPLPRWGLVAAKVTALILIELVQVVLLTAVAALAFGWAPGSDWSPILAFGAVVLGTTTFASLGLLLAGTLRAEATLAIANGLFLAFLMLGGIVVPIDRLPAAIRPISSVLPSTALADLLRIALDGGSLAAPGGAVGSPVPAVATLLAWAGIALLGTRFARWD